MCIRDSEYPDEASFLAHFITRPVEEWFDTWESGAVEQLHLQEEPFYAYDAFAYQKVGNIYVPSSDCYEFLEDVYKRQGLYAVKFPKIIDPSND